MRDYMQRKLHPLAIHLGVAAANMGGIQQYASNFSHSLSENDIVQLVRGIKIYQEHDFQGDVLPTDTIWSHGGTSVKKPAVVQNNGIRGETPLLLVPSLINKANILDLSRQRSMLRWFNGQGIETYLLDWGEFLSKTDKNIDIAEIIHKKLRGAIRAVSKITNNRQIDLLGYCMGGTLLLPAYSFEKEHIRSMILLAAPWDFQAGKSNLARNVRIWSSAVLPVIKERGYLPAEWVQALFASLDPNGSAQKFIKFAKMDQNSPEARLFVMVEDWLNDGIDLPLKISQHCIQDWFIDNKLALGNWHIGQQHIDTKQIHANILILASYKDQIVPFDCAVNICKSLNSSNIDIIELNCGHIGLIVGKKAIDDVWKPILSWLVNK